MPALLRADSGRFPQPAIFMVLAETKVACAFVKARTPDLAACEGGRRQQIAVF
jgi:hypothetical protein